MAEQTKKPDFEASLKELEGIVTQLESGDLSLDQSLSAYERGVNLTRQCEKALSTAEQKVQKLLDESGNVVAEPFDEKEASKMEGREG